MESYDATTDQFLPNAAVVARDGEVGTLLRVDGTANQNEGALIVALTGSDREVTVPMSAVDLAASSVDRIVLSVPAASITGDAPPRPQPTAATTVSTEETLTVSLAEEELVARKRERDLGSVRFEKRVETHPARLTTDVGHEEVTFERVPVNQPVDAAPESRFEGDTLIIPVVEEVLVTEKRLVVREEVHIRRHWVTEPVTVEDTVRREVLDIDEGGSASPPGGSA